MAETPSSQCKGPRVRSLVGELCSTAPNYNRSQIVLLKILCAEPTPGAANEKIHKSLKKNVDLIFANPASQLTQVHVSYFSIDRC